MGETQVPPFPSISLRDRFYANRVLDRLEHGQISKTQLLGLFFGIVRMFLPSCVFPDSLCMVDGVDTVPSFWEKRCSCGTIRFVGGKRAFEVLFFVSRYKF